METTLAVQQRPGLTLVGDPQEMLEAASKVAKVLMGFVEQQSLVQMYGKKKHLMFEAWLMLARWHGTTVTYPTELVRFFELETGEEGYEATAKVISVGTGEWTGVEASAMCTNMEENWSTRPKFEYPNGQKTEVGRVIVPRFQLRSMAMTRAGSKALGVLYRHIVVLAGFDPTPAEEITGTENGGRTVANGKHHTVPNGSEKSEGPKKISDAQRKRIFAIAHSKNCPMPEIVKILKAHNFALANDVTVDRYDAVVKEIENYKAQP